MGSEGNLSIIFFFFLDIEGLAFLKFQINNMFAYNALWQKIAEPC